ncbi:MAG: carbohydrate deacetylase [Kofleriaceae bacterium]
MPTRTLIVNADDLGYDPAVTRGILEGMDRGIVSSATFMVNTPFSVEAAAVSKGRALGLHLNLARWATLSGRIPAQLLAGGELIEANAGQLPADAVEAETLAQLDRFRELLGQDASHIDVHKHLHTHANVLEGLCAAARARRLPVRSINAQMRSALRERKVATNDHFIGGADGDAYWTVAQLEAELGQLEDGVTELMCHPGYAPTHVKSGYSVQREVELATLTHPNAKAMVTRAGATLATFAAVRLP